MATRQEVNEVTGIIYKKLFNMSRDEFIAAAKERAGEKWNYIGWDDDDEAARDWLSLEALQALNAAESECSMNYRKLFIGVDIETMKAVTEYTMSQFKPVSVVWD